MLEICVNLKKYELEKFINEKHNFITENSGEEDYMVIELVLEKVDFLVSTTDLKVIYTESKGVKLFVDVQT